MGAMTMGKWTAGAGRGAARAGRRGVMAVAVMAAVLTACTTPGSESLAQIKASHYGQLAQQDATRVSAGTGQSIVEFTVEDTPPSIFVNYVVPDAQAAAFETFIDLPPAFSLAKVQHPRERSCSAVLAQPERVPRQRHHERHCARNGPPTWMTERESPAS